MTHRISIYSLGGDKVARITSGERIPPPIGDNGSITLTKFSPDNSWRLAFPLGNTQGPSRYLLHPYDEKPVEIGTSKGTLNIDYSAYRIGFKFDPSICEVTIPILARVSLARGIEISGVMAITRTPPSFNTTMTQIGDEIMRVSSAVHTFFCRLINIIPHSYRLDEIGDEAMITLRDLDIQHQLYDPIVRGFAKAILDKTDYPSLLHMYMTYMALEDLRGEITGAMRNGNTEIDLKSQRDIDDRSFYVYQPTMYSNEMGNMLVEPLLERLRRYIDQLFEHEEILSCLSVIDPLRLMAINIVSNRMIRHFV